jgi:glycosyltransferase involved in cell wall biosynthesis
MTATVHDVFALQRPELCTRANLSHFKRMLPISLERAARIITPTEAVRQDVLRWGELRREEEEAGGSLSQIPSLSSEPVRNAYDFSDKTITIPWGVNHEIWRPASPEERAEARKSCGVDGPFFLIVARLEPKKNIPFAIRAWFAAVMAKKLPHALVLAGPKGWGAEKEIDAEARDLGMSNRFKRLGFVSRETLRGLYSETSALLMPSLAEGFGLPLLEGMACGAPVLAADIPSLREAAGASDNAILSNPGDLKQWREAIEAIAEDSDLRARLREAGLKRASMFSWQKTAQLYWKVYREEYEEDKKRREE